MTKAPRKHTARLCALGALGALLLLSAACKGGSDAGSSDGETASADGPTVAFLLSTLQEERYQKDLKHFEQTAKKLGLRVLTMAADNDNAKQLAQIEDSLTRGATVLVVQPTDSNAAAAYVKKAHAEGAKIVAYDRVINNAKLDYYVAHDSYKVGVLQAEAAIEATGGKGNFIILAGQSGHSVAEQITAGVEDTLAPYIEKGDVTVVAKQSHSAWAPEQALRTIEDAISSTGGKIDAVLANNSGMARGAIQALAATGLDRVFVAGADADAANVNFVCEGKQSVEVLKAIKPLAETAARVAADLAVGKTPSATGETQLNGTAVATVAVPVSLIRPANVKQHILDSGFLTAGDIPACARFLGGAAKPAE